MAGNYFPAQAKVSPNFTEPGLIITYAQASGAFRATLPGGDPKVKIGDDDLFVYVNALDLRTEAVGAQAAGNFLPSVSLVGTFYKTATYLIRNRCLYNHHDTAAAANYAVALPAALELAQRQGIFMQERNMLLYGFNAANGEGLMNAAGATAVTLPADTYGHTTVRTYDPGQLAIFFLDEIVNLITGMFQSGMPFEVNLLGPQRILNQMSLAGIVQITSYQRTGAGTESVSGMIKDMVGRNGGTFNWFYDDTLIGQGAGGADALIMTIPEIEVPTMAGINTDAFGNLMPGINYVNAMYSAFAAPIKIPTPVPDGGITEVLETRTTSGWNLRPQGLYILSLPY